MWHISWYKSAYVIANNCPTAGIWPAPQGIACHDTRNIITVVAYMRVYAVSLPDGGGREEGSFLPLCTAGTYKAESLQP